jgi:hypothetical protein
VISFHTFHQNSAIGFTISFVISEDRNAAITAIHNIAIDTKIRNKLHIVPSKLFQSAHSVF